MDWLEKLAPADEEKPDAVADMVQHAKAAGILPTDWFVSESEQWRWRSGYAEDSFPLAAGEVLLHLLAECDKRGWDLNYRTEAITQAQWRGWLLFPRIKGDGIHGGPGALGLLEAMVAAVEAQKGGA